jgi:hypothetical protein
MALLADGDIVTLDLLQERESGLLDMAAAEGVNLQSKIALATAAVTAELELFLERNGYGRDTTGIVVTELLKEWITATTLQLAYRDAYHTQLNDRHTGKILHYEKVAERARRLLFETGPGSVSKPLLRPAAPVVTPTAGTGPAASYAVRTSWVDDSGAESAPSPVATLETGANSAIQVSVERPCEGATGWNVYAGTDSLNTTRQNAIRLPLTGVWTGAADTLIRGSEPPCGQAPSCWLTPVRVLNRG